MSEEKETATDADRISLATVCMLEGTSRGAELHHFCNSAVHLAGRGSDIANTDLKDISSVTRVYQNSEDLYLSQKLNRFKTRTVGTHRLFPHRSRVECCYYFSLAYILVMGDDSNIVGEEHSTKLFPTFAPKITNSDGRLESKLSSVFGNLIDQHVQIIFDYFSGESWCSICHL